jgi:hypothetical protein
VQLGEATGEGDGDRCARQVRRTAELVRTANVVSSQQKVVLRIVRNLDSCYVWGIVIGA